MRAEVLSIAFLVSVSNGASAPCPDGYTQSPNGGDCFKLNYYYSELGGVHYPPKTYDEAEYDCNGGLEGHGGMLASIHSQEENDYMLTLRENNIKYCGYQSSTNIGLRCVGMDCAWDDGSPISYTNFANDALGASEGPQDDGETRCFGVKSYDSSWSSKHCGGYDADCWLCSLKARTIECNQGETPLKGGCVSVHKTPLDQKSAEASCVEEGGHLVSIHSGNGEAGDYAAIAWHDGVHSTIYIGGQFSNGKFEWIDGSYVSWTGWATGFPNMLFGNCVQMLLASEFGNAGMWTNVECDTKLPYMCFRNGADYGPTAFPSHPKADAHCPSVQYYTSSGSIYSPNYPLSIPSVEQKCEYVIATKDGTEASVKFPVFDCQVGTTLSLYDGLNSHKPFITFDKSTPSINQSYTAQSNVLKMVFSTTTSAVGTGWEAEFSGV